MAISQDLQEPQAATVKGKLRYVAAGYVPQASTLNFHLPALSEFKDERILPLYNMRPVPSVLELPSAINHPQLDTHGFTAVRHVTTLNAAPHHHSSWRNPELLKQHYVPETEDMMRQITGCKTVVTETLLLRSATWSESDALATHGQAGGTHTEDEPGLELGETLSEPEIGFPQFIGFNQADGGVSPAPKIHLDYAPRGARVHIRKYHPELTQAASEIIKAEDTLLSEGKGLRDYYRDCDGPRWAIFSVWRPLKTVKRDPLALGDQRTFQPEDYVPVNVKFPFLGQPGVTGAHDVESYLSRYSEGQKWFWIEEQRPEEVLVIGLFDSDAEKSGSMASGGTLHSSVDLPGTEDAEARESLELRCLCIW